MKDRNHHQVIVRRGAEDYRSKGRLLIFFLLLTIGISAEMSQIHYIDVKDRFASGENVSYDVYFKWGLIMPRAGVASMSMKDSYYAGKPAYHYQLLFNTSGLFEKVYRMRDTLECYFSPNMLLLHSQKRVNENDYYLIDDISFRYTEKAIFAHSHRYTPERTKIDTVLVSHEKYMFDMLGASLYLRSIDWEGLEVGETFPFKVAIGKDMVNITYRYSGQQIIERGEKLKYRTRHFYIDIYDEAFTQSKAAAEIWVGDDENHLVIKVRAKLKIGAAEVYYKSSSGLRYPLKCEVKIPKK